MTSLIPLLSASDNSIAVSFRNALNAPSSDTSKIEEPVISQRNKRPRRTAAIRGERIREEMAAHGII